ncbi:unnamed protein product [Linum trigynum]|uniref:Uncharacterized protein n=1 Tax=Linum trigynum TaxID=586398 RepID=A0AAV2G605_9ROSI
MPREGAAADIPDLATTQSSAGYGEQTQYRRSPYRRATWRQLVGGERKETALRRDRANWLLVKRKLVKNDQSSGAD